MTTAAALVFDGDCGFCTLSANWIQVRTAGRIEIVPWQRADLVRLGLTAAECARAVQYVDAEGRWSAGAAVAHALIACRRPWPAVGWLMQRRAVVPVVERAYRAVAAHRHRLPGSTPACRA